MPGHDEEGVVDADAEADHHRHLRRDASEFLTIDGAANYLVKHAAA